ncbi:MAG: hypothetical protein ABIJ21_04345 [Nanoarchaeota archaeon]
MKLRKLLAYVLWFILSFPFAYAIAIVLGLLFNAIFNTREHTIWFIVPVSLIIAFFLMRLVMAISKKKYRRQAIAFKAVLILCVALSLIALFFDMGSDGTVNVEMCLFDYPFKCAEFGVVGEEISARLISTETVVIKDVRVDVRAGKKIEALPCINGCSLMSPSVDWAKEEARKFIVAVPGLQDDKEVEILLTIAYEADGLPLQARGSVLVYP